MARLVFCSFLSSSVHTSQFSCLYFWVFLFILLSFIVHTSDTLMLFLGADVWYHRWQGEQRRQQRKTGTDQWSLRQVNKQDSQSGNRSFWHGLDVEAHNNEHEDCSNFLRPRFFRNIPAFKDGSNIVEDGASWRPFFGTSLASLRSLRPEDQTREHPLQV